MKLSTKKLISTAFVPGAVLAATLVMSGARSAGAQTLLLRYTFDESDSGSAEAADSGAPPAAAGVFVGASRIGNTPGGHSKGAVDFMGAVSPDNLKYVHGGDAAKLDGLETFTLTAWINAQDTPSGNRRILAKQGAGSFPGFSWNVNDPAEGGRSASNFGLRLFVGGEKGFQHDLSGPRVTIDADKKWVFIAVTYDGRLETDNVLYYSGSVTEVVTNQVATSINAGKTTETEARFTVSHTDAAITANTALQGWMDDVRVYSGVLNAAQLEAVRLENLPPSAPPKAISILNPKRSGTTVTFEFQSEAGRNHQVEFKASLGDPTWQALTTLTGTGANLLVTDNNAASATRFYRIATR
ncbi:MAG: hypothetical protein HY735_08540 [Verrucomicrobia bacterium]|nr:hypothetical protein [Verrucomicrobiota bacterium]